MKINFVLPTLNITGGVRVIFEYANRLVERGHHVTILSPVIPPRMEDQLFDIEAKASQILNAGANLLSGTTIDWFDLQASVQLIPSLTPSVMSSTEWLVPAADITVATSWETAYAVDALDESKGEKSYFVQHYEIWDTWDSDDAWKRASQIQRRAPISMKEVEPPDPRARRQKRLVDKTYTLPLSLITVSSWLEELLTSGFNQSIVATIPNAVNHDVFYPDPTREFDDTIVLLPSRDTAWKGERETRYLAESLGSKDGVKSYIYGSNHQTSNYPGYVTHYDEISDARLRQLYSDADIFVLPSWVEGFGLQPLEAMACKCTVVTTNVGGVPDYAHDGTTASIVPPRDGQALLSAVEELISDDEKRRRLAENAYETVHKYSWDDATTEFEQALEVVTA